MNLTVVRKLDTTKVKLTSSFFQVFRIEMSISRYITLTEK